MDKRPEIMAMLLRALRDECPMSDVASAMREGLSTDEMAGIVVSALWAMPARCAHATVAGFYDARAMPAPPLDGKYMPDARFWASMASPVEMKAYAVAILDALPAEDRKGLAEFVAKQVAA